jgi:hypothetical protein
LLGGDKHSIFLVSTHLYISCVNDELSRRKSFSKSSNSCPKDSLTTPAGIAIRVEKSDPELAVIVATGGLFVEETEPDFDDENENDGDDKAAEKHQ